MLPSLVLTFELGDSGLSDPEALPDVIKQPAKNVKAVKRVSLFILLPEEC